MLGSQRLFAKDAKQHVDRLCDLVKARWREKISEGRFMTALKAGTLSREAIRIFWRNHWTYAIEINALIAASYQRHLAFFKQRPDLMGALGDKIADEFIHPRSPGHILLIFQSAKAMGLTPEDIWSCSLLPKARAVLDFKKCLLWEGTTAEWWASILTEESFGHYVKEWNQALKDRYGFSEEDRVYFNKHYEADVKEHDGIMAHGQFNRTVLEAILECGHAQERPGYGLEYCASTAVDLMALQHQAAWEAAAEA